MAQNDRNLNPYGKHEPLSGHGAASEAVPPRQTGGTPGYGAHGMGYAHGSAWGVYGVPRNVEQDYVDASRSHAPGAFDQPHGRVGFGWEGAFGSEGEHSSRADRIRPAEPPSAYAPQHELADSAMRERARRGPKNYTRSDERIFDEIHDAIVRDPRLDASGVTIEVQGGKVILYGSVAHRQMKHWIEDIASECYGVSEVENKLTVAIAAATPADRKLSPRGVGR